MGGDERSLDLLVLLVVVVAVLGCGFGVLGREAEVRIGEGHETHVVLDLNVA